MMAAITDETLMAWVDGELDQIAARRIELALSGDSALRARVEDQKRLRERLARRYDAVADEPVPERFRAMLETNVVDLAGARPRARLRPLWVRAAAVAATFGVGFLSAELLTRSDAPGRFDGGSMIASGPLAEALEHQLAAAQPAGAATRIGVSFAAADGRLCRTFETTEAAGLACRGERAWELVTTARTGAGASGEYRQAASGSALVMQAAQEMMAGEAFDAEAERRARDAGWRGTR